jgi:hypothetical protein
MPSPTSEKLDAHLGETVTVGVDLMDHGRSQTGTLGQIKEGANPGTYYVSSDGRQYGFKTRITVKELDKFADTLKPTEGGSSQVPPR